MVEKEKDLKVKSIRSDRGGEFLSENFARWCKSEGIRHQLTTTYTPSQNGVVERKNRTIMEMARAMLAHASLPRSYWAEACNTAVYIQMRSPTHALQDMTPFQAYYGRKPTVSHFRVFGCSAFVHIPKEKRQKLDFKSRKLLFLGYSAESDAYRLYDPDTRTTTVSRDVVFDESFITSAEGAAAQPIPILPPPSLPDPPASPVITPSTSHPVPPIQPPDVSPDHALSDSDSDLDVADATPEVDSAPPRREKRIPGWLYSTALIRPSPALHGLMPDNAFGEMQVGTNNPMYGNIGVQPGFQCAIGSYGMPGANMGMVGFSQPYAQNLNLTGRAGGNFGSGMPLLNAPAYDNLMSKGKPKDYKEGGQAVKFDTFHGILDKLKALLFLQQFDVAFAGGNFTEFSKIRKAATFLKTNALQLFPNNAFWKKLVIRGSLSLAIDCGIPWYLIVRFLCGISDPSHSIVNVGDEEGWTALHSAVSSGHLSIVEILLQAGADVSSVTNGGRTALHYAASKGRLKLAEVLIAHESNVNEKDQFGCTPLHRAASAGHSNVCELLIEEGAKVDATDKTGQTPLMYATICNDKQVALLLIRHGADVDIEDKEGYTVLGRASDELRPALIDAAKAMQEG
ncbi:hypothetical protein L7F22_028925 [Adiantum nelumboides]|nr:hypothetical protein [Adiantum nelumboides]